MISSSYDTVAEKSLFFAEMAKEIYNESKLEESCLKSTGARFLYLAQVIATLVTLPLNILAMIFCPAFALCTEGSEEAWELFKSAVRVEFMHYTLLPVFTLGVFAPEYTDLKG